MATGDITNLQATFISDLRQIELIWDGPDGFDSLTNMTEDKTALFMDYRIRVISGWNGGDDPEFYNLRNPLCIVHHITNIDASAGVKIDYTDKLKLGSDGQLVIVVEVQAFASLYGGPSEPCGKKATCRLVYTNSLKDFGDITVEQLPEENYKFHMTWKKSLRGLGTDRLTMLSAVNTDEGLSPLKTSSFGVIASSLKTENKLAAADLTFYLPGIYYAVINRHDGILSAQSPFVKIDATSIVPPSPEEAYANWDEDSLVLRWKKIPHKISYYIISVNGSNDYKRTRKNDGDADKYVITVTEETSKKDEESEEDTGDKKESESKEEIEYETTILKDVLKLSPDSEMKIKIIGVISLGKMQKDITYYDGALLYLEPFGVKLKENTFAPEFDPEPEPESLPAEEDNEGEGESSGDSEPNTDSTPGQA